MEKENGNYKLIFSSLDRFYKECDEIETTGNCRDIPNFSTGFEDWKDIEERDDEDWIGLSREEILKSKYIYKEGLDQLKEIERDLNLGGTKRSYKWDEIDGDDMNYDRYIDELPYLKKRIKTIGKGKGKIINIHVSVGENCNVSYKDMLMRSYTVMRVIDYLENLGFRVGVTVYSDVRNLGYYKEERVNSLHVEVQIKKPEEPLIKGLILTCISPWMLRHHFFKLWTAKFKCVYGLGQAYSVKYTDTETDIYFQTGSCLDEKTCNNKIEKLAKQFSFDE